MPILAKVCDKDGVVDWCMPLTGFEGVLAFSDGTTWTPLKPQHSIPWLVCPVLSKKVIIKSWLVDLLSGLLGSGRVSMLFHWKLSLGLWVIAVDPAFIEGHQSIKNCGIWIDQLDHLLAVMTTSFWSSEHPWNKIRANLPHLQFLTNCVRFPDIQLCTYCLDTRRSLSMKFFIWPINSVAFWFPYSSHTYYHPRLPAFLESMALKNWCLIHAKRPKSSLKHSIHLWHFFQV